MKKSLCALLLLALLALAPAALCEDASIDVGFLIPAALNVTEESGPVALYCGPTQGFYRHNEQTIDLSAPFVCFGQYDCWAMVAAGTPESFGPVGWVESALLGDLTGVPQLSFDDALSAMVEETAPMTNDPFFLSDAVWTSALPRGAEVTLLAQYGDWLYVQTSIGDIPARVFIPLSSVL